MINVTDRAATEMRRLIEEQEPAAAAIRVFVREACGCGAAKYGMGLDDEIGEGDGIIEAQGVKLVVDSDSASHLEGVEIDYSDSLMGRGFTIKDPNRTGGGCGCGGG